MIPKINIPKQKINIKKLTTTTTNAMTITTIVNKMNASQQHTDQANIILSTVNNPNTPLCGQTKACGLFDSSFEESFTIDDQINKPDDMALIDEIYDVNCNIQNSANLNNSDFFANDDDNKIYTDKVYTDMDDQSFYNQIYINEDLDCEKQVNIPEVLSKSSFDVIDNNTNTDADIVNTPTSKTGKFFEKVKEQNLKIKMPESRPVSQNFLQIEDYVSNIITPGTYAQLFESIPTPVLPTTGSVLENVELLLMTPQIINQANTNPFFNTMTMNNHISNFEVKQEVAKETLESEFEYAGIVRSPSIVESVSLDHDYVQSPKKRKLSESFDDASQQSVETTVTATNTVVPATSNTCDSNTLDTQSSTSSGKRKKQRTKGIYRAQDVTNDTELQNYLERRRKNNISSKHSRLSKKKLYIDMDEKSRQLERDNERLKNTITHLESLTKLMKDMLLQKITSK